jgi:hypothetical protein
VLFRRRQVWLPSLWGALLLLALAAFIGVGLAFSAYRLLAPHSPAAGARTLVVEGWLDPGELRQAAAAARSGGYERVLTTGGPIDPSMDVGGWQNFASRAAARLRAEGLASVPVIAVPAPATAQERSYLSALMVRAWVKQNDPALAALDLYSAGVHARRSWRIYRMAFGDKVEVGVMAATPSDHDAQRWWTSSAGAKSVLGETISLAWTSCCFWPGAPE